VLLKTLILKTCRLYNVFGSGSTHGIYAQFIAQSALANHGRPIGLLRGAGTRMATWFYAMHRLLRMKSVLLATIHQPKFASLALNERCRLAVHDIESPGFWKAIYFLLRAVYPALKALRYCDSNTPAMDKIIYLVHRATESINKSIDFFNDSDIFETMEDDDGVAFERIEIFESCDGGGNEVKGNVFCDEERYVQYFLLGSFCYCCN
jgi:hypothetical protein